MKRRKFIKSVMSLGVGRNMANIMADACRLLGESYSKGFDRYRKHFEDPMRNDYWETRYCGQFRKIK